MLYVSTRSKTDSYTAHRVLNEDRAPDGGFFIPFRLPEYDQATIKNICEGSFGEAVAHILNEFFSANVSAWDVDCAIGKVSVKIISTPHRVLLAQLWNNPGDSYDYICTTLYNRLSGGGKRVTEWARIAIRIAILFGLYTVLSKQNMETFDVSVNTGDFSDPTAAWYAKKMGLPIGTIVCACNDNSAVWDFLHRGELNTGASVVQSNTPALDIANPAGLERLIFSNFGYEETQKYLLACQKRRIYQIRPDMLNIISEGFFVSVVGVDRVSAVINSVYRSNNYILDPYCAVSYGSLQDYRAKTGESCPTVLLWDYSPLRSIAVVQNALGIGKIEIENQLKKI